jgi:DNA modification methylase
MKTFHDGKVTLHAGDCLEVLKAMPENSIDAVVTDPPYHLTSIVKRFGAENVLYQSGAKRFTLLPAEAETAYGHVSRLHGQAVGWR